MPVDPKVKVSSLGLDVLLDASQKSWLLEVAEAVTRLGNESRVCMKLKLIEDVISLAVPNENLDGAIDARNAYRPVVPILGWGKRIWHQNCKMPEPRRLSRSRQPPWVSGLKSFRRQLVFYMRSRIARHPGVWMDRLCNNAHSQRLVFD
jgi:hypothetical protein